MASKSPPVLRLVRIVSKSRGQSTPKYNLQISCHVKPNASTRREGITGVNSDQVEVCVAALPKEGEANAAVAKVFAEVFNVPKSNVEALRGGKSRDKTLCITDVDIGKDNEERFLQRAHELLNAAVVQK